MKEKFPAPTRRITNAVKMSKVLQGKTEFIYVAEAFTSQVCNQYKAKNLTNAITARSKRKYTQSLNATLVVRYAIMM